MNDKFDSYTFGEARTGGGQFVEFTCISEDIEKVKKFLVENVRHIEIPSTAHIANPQHGAYGKYSRYKIVQHKYAGGGGPGYGGYIEALEIENPPDNRHGIVVYQNLNSRSSFTEWKTLEDAKAAFEKGWCKHNIKEEFPKYSGFIRWVDCGLLQPWFYAIGDEELVGDYAFPEGLQDDPVYRFGRKFIVADSDGNTRIKTCMGTRFVQKEKERYSHHDKKEIEIYRLICWDDGTVTRNDCHYCSLKNEWTRPLEEDEVWITEAVEQFKKLLSGQTQKFEINFMDGNKFVGKILKNGGSKIYSSQGRYSLKVYFEDNKKPKEGCLDFTPTPECPDMILDVNQRYKKKIGKEPERIEIIEKQVVTGGKKWAGVFYRFPKNKAESEKTKE